MKYDIMELCYIMTKYIYTYVDIHHQHQQFTWPFSLDSPPFRWPTPCGDAQGGLTPPEETPRNVKVSGSMGWYQAEKNRKPMETHGKHVFHRKP